MTNLPALPPYDQAIAAEALAYAKRELNKYFSMPDNPWSGTDAPLVSAEAGHAYLRTLVENMMMMNSAIARMQVVEMAKQGIEEAADALRHVVIESRSRRVELPTEIEAYEMVVRARGSDRWPKKSGPKGTDNMMRDLVMVMTVAGVCDRYGLNPTQRSAKTVSGCAIVAQAAFGSGQGKAYSTIAKIWQRLGRAMPTVPGWAGK